VLQLQGTWLLLVTGGGPTRDKPTVHFGPPADPDRVDHELTLRVPDCQAAYETLRGRGAEFLTAPVAYEHEIRAFFRDPDGHLLEISEVR
jgi:catechol 2,3-dioxygenase-like lactoylglutathione lyase family enzyme